jgi:hypothetical protein
MVNKLVMIINDSPTVRKIVEICLQREVVSFPDGVEALRVVNNQLPGHLLQRECRLKEECYYTKKSLGNKISYAAQKI